MLDEHNILDEDDDALEVFIINYSYQLYTKIIYLRKFILFYFLLRMILATPILTNQRF